MSCGAKASCWRKGRRRWLAWTARAECSLCPISCARSKTSDRVLPLRICENWLMENASLEKRILAEDRGDQKMVRAGWLARLCMAFFLGSVLFTWMIGC